MSDTIIPGVLPGTDLVTNKQMEQNESTPIYYEHRKPAAKRFTNAGITRDSKYPIFAYGFNLYGIDSVNEYDEIDFDTVITRMINYCGSMFSDFHVPVEEGETPEPGILRWLEINALFFQTLFFNKNVFVHWDDMDERWSIYLSFYDDTLGDLAEYTFLNVQTNETEIFTDPESQLIEVTWNGREEDRYKMWFDLSYFMQIGRDLSLGLLTLYCKRCTLNLDSNTHQLSNDSIANLKKQFTNKATFWVKDTNQSMIKVLENPIISGADLESFAKFMYLVFDRESSEMGRVANLNPKPERKTSAEQYQAVDKVGDDMQARKEQLLIFTLRCEELGWPVIKFETTTPISVGLVEGEKDPSQSTPGGFQKGGFPGKETDEENV